MNAPLLEWRQVRAIAAKEFRDRIRNRWVLVAALLFSVFALVIAFLGSAESGAVGFRGIELTIASLVSLAIYLLPLIALVLGYDAIVGERERGSLDLLLSLPVTRLELLLGKYLGLAAALASSTLAGFGLAGALLLSRGDTAGITHYAGFMASAILMGMAFLSMAVAVSVSATERTRASGLAIGLWFFFVLVFDLLLLGLLVAVGGDGPGALLPYLLLLNPADVFRVMNIFGLEELRNAYGLATVFPPALASPWLLGGIMLAWITAPLAVALWRFR